MVASIGGIGALVSGGSALAGLLGVGKSTPAAPPPVYQPQNSQGADTGAYSGTQNLSQYNTAGTALPYANQTFQSLYNNPYASTYQSGANAIAPAATAGGAQQFNAGTNLTAAGQSYLPYAQQALSTAYDPRNALYAQQYQQNNDQVNAGLAARGLATTPYGAGVQNTADQQFNTNWLQTALQRQATGAQTASTLTGAAGTAGTTGAGLQTTGLNTSLQGASLPYSTANTIGQGQNSAIQSYGGFGQAASTIPSQQIADYLQYLGVGNQSAGVANSAYANQLTAQNQNFNQMQTLGKNLGSSLSGLGSYFGGANPNTGYTTAQAYAQANPYASMPQAGVNF